MSTPTLLTPGPGQALRVADLVRQAAQLVPALRARAAEAERLRRIPDETVADLVNSGLLRIATPTRYGGYGFDYDATLEVIVELARGCGSTAWCFSIWSSHNWAVGFFPEETQVEYFADGPDVLCASSVGPVGRAEPVAGGYRLSGHWEFSSGCDPATWNLLGASTPDGPIWTLVPRADFRILDTWHVSGMRGTGSKDIVVEDAFVPTRRTVATAGLGLPPYDAYRLLKLPSYRLPVFSFFGWTLASPIVGLALAMVEEFTERTVRLPARGRSPESVPMQTRLAEAAAEADTARTIMRATCRELLDKAAREEDLTELERARFFRDRAFAVKLSIDAVNRLFEASGGHALFEAEPIQRMHRDALAASHRAGLILDLGVGQVWARAAFDAAAGAPPGPVNNLPNIGA